MGLYNMVFGENPDKDTLLNALNLTNFSFYRFRDVFVNDKGEIAVYTRGGGGNRDCNCGADETPGTPHSEDCVITMQAKLRQHPLYIRDADDDYDQTYATFYFKAPENLNVSNMETEPERNLLWEAFLGGIEGKDE